MCGTDDWKLFVVPFNENVHYKPTLDRLVKLNQTKPLSDDGRQSLRLALLYFNEFELSLQRHLLLCANNIASLDSVSVQYHRYVHGKALRRLVRLFEYLIANELIILSKSDSERLDTVRCFIDY